MKYISLAKQRKENDFAKEIFPFDRHLPLCFSLPSAPLFRIYSPVINGGAVNAAIGKRGKKTIFIPSFVRKQMAAVYIISHDYQKSNAQKKPNQHHTLPLLLYYADT